MTATTRQAVIRCTRAALAAALICPTIAMAGGFYTSWSPSVPAPDTANSVAGGCPIEARDGLALYTAREGGSNIYANERSGIDEAFGPAEKLPAPVNTDAREFCPSPAGGEYLLFVSTRAGGCDPSGVTGDIWIVRRGAADGWGEPKHLGCVEDGTGPNSAGSEFSPSLLTTWAGTFLYFSSDVGGDQDIYVSRRHADGSFGVPEAVHELNTPDDDRMPTISRDGREIVFSSNRSHWGWGWPSAGGQDVYTSKRRSLFSRWARPRNLSVMSGFGTAPFDETRASFSWDGLRLYYGSGGEIYISERESRWGN